MYKILKKEKLSPEVFRFTLSAPLIAKERKAGQFVIIQKGGDYEERIPLTIADSDREKGTIDIVFQAVGDGTHRLALMNEGDPRISRSTARSYSSGAVWVLRPCIR